jgi:hypothetical protein
MKRLHTSFGSCEPPEPYPPPCFNLINNLNHVSVFHLTLRLSDLPPRASPYLRTLADTTLLHGCWLINIRDSVFSFISLYCSTNHFILVCSKFVFHQIFFTSHPLRLVTHFLLFPTLFTFLTSFSQLASLLACCCFLCSLWPLP